MAFADRPEGPRKIALPYYRVQVLDPWGPRRHLDLEAFLSKWALPRHACLLVDSPQHGSGDPPEGYKPLRPYGEPEDVIGNLVGLVGRLREEVERQPRVQTAGRGIPGILARLFLGGGRAGRVQAVEVRLAYSVCADVFGDPPFSTVKVSGGTLVWKPYILYTAGGEAWLVRAWDGGRERRLTRVLEESEEAKKALLEAARSTS